MTTVWVCLSISHTCSPKVSFLIGKNTGRFCEENSRVGTVVDACFGSFCRNMEGFPAPLLGWFVGLDFTTTVKF